ncbi:MAG: hypothetical protein JO122_13305 [Acetobacteraceae bacterium]|nr:hypothetical protein [Acetobacteraceae bacterium]
MPVAGEALIRVAQDYHRFLCARLRELEDLRAAGALLPPLGVADAARLAAFYGWQVHSGDWPTFTILRRVARAGQMARRAPGVEFALRPEHDVILDRIISNCDQLKGILLGLDRPEVAIDQQVVALAEMNREPFPHFSPDAIVKLRKIWEIGTATVVMQTVIQIDGDVVSRILPRRDDAETRVLNDIHQSAVEVSFKHWTFLVQLAESFVSSALGHFFPAG